VLPIAKCGSRRSVLHHGPLNGEEGYKIISLDTKFASDRQYENLPATCASLLFAFNKFMPGQQACRIVENAYLATAVHWSGFQCDCLPHACHFTVEHVICTEHPIATSRQLVTAFAIGRTLFTEPLYLSPRLGLWFVAAKIEHLMGPVALS
jgi:hypothetical protein